MRILFVFPFCSPLINSISSIPLYLGETNHQVLVISAQSANSLKGNVFSIENEIIGNTEFFRPYLHSNDIKNNDQQYWKKTKRKINDFDPQIIVGFGESNFNLSLQIRNEFKIPLIVFLEYIKKKPPMIPFKGRKWVRKFLPFLFSIISKYYLKKIASNSAAIIFSYYGDRDYIPMIESMGSKAFYVPWCSDIGDFIASRSRKTNTGIYIGSLEPFKNSKELIASISLILNEMPEQKFIVIGPGSLSKKIIEMVPNYNGRLEYYKSLSREAALKILSTATYGLTSVKDSGLGFIGDCWATQTPLVSFYDLNGFLKDGIDAFIIRDRDLLPNLIKKLLCSPEMYSLLQQQGYLRYLNNYTGKVLGKKYLEIIANVTSIQV